MQQTEGMKPIVIVGLTVLACLSIGSQLAVAVIVMNGNNTSQAIMERIQDPLKTFSCVVPHITDHPECLQGNPLDCVCFRIPIVQQCNCS